MIYKHLGTNDQILFALTHPDLLAIHKAHTATPFRPKRDIFKAPTSDQGDFTDDEESSNEAESVAHETCHRDLLTCLKTFMGPSYILCHHFGSFIHVTKQAKSWAWNDDIVHEGCKCDRCGWMKWQYYDVLRQFTTSHGSSPSDYKTVEAQRLKDAQSQGLQKTRILGNLDMWEWVEQWRKSRDKKVWAVEYHVKKNLRRMFGRDWDKSLNELKKIQTKVRLTADGVEEDRYK